MSTNHQQAEPSPPSHGYTYLLGFWRESWFKAFVILEIVFFGGGYVVSLFGTEATDALGGEAPDFHLALGGIMGALGIVFAGFLLIAIGMSVWIRLQKIMEPDIEF